MREVEVKILDIEKEEISDKILNLGGKKIDENVVVDVFYDYPDSKLKNRKEFIRIRTIGEDNILTYKYSKEESKDFKIRQEIELNVSNAKNLKKILMRLGLKEYRHIEKRRTSFELGNVKLEIDEYPEIPPLLEIESDDENMITKTLKKLDFSTSKAKPINNRDVLKKYGKDPDNARF